MKTQELEALGLTKEQVTEVFRLNGIDIAAEQKKTTAAEGERDNFKSQFETAQAALKDFEGINVKDLQSKIKTLNDNLKAKDTEYQQKLADRDFTDALKASITAAGGKSDKAIMAMLDINTLKASKNQKEDIQSALEAVKKDNDYLFQTGKTTPRVVSGTAQTQVDNNDKKAQANEAFRALLGKEN